jgi:predicted metal-dependent phosphoesterase TrpH
MNAQIKVDFHTHTIHSADSLTHVEDLLKTARKRGLDKIAVTDHNALKGAQEAYTLDPHCVIIAEEIQTTKGELLGYYLTEKIPPLLEPLETIQRLRAQNAVISIPHPFDPYRSRWTLDDLIELAPLVDGIEAFNARCFAQEMNDKAAQFAREHGLVMTAGSDAHAAHEVGNGALLLPAFSNVDELREALREASVVGRRASVWVRFSSMYARLYKRLTGMR